LIAIADVQAALAAVPPDCVLDEPGKDLWKRWVELPGIDVFGDDLKNVGTAAGLVANRQDLQARRSPTVCASISSAARWAAMRRSEFAALGALPCEVK
jgi:hypothetical protein